MFSRLRLLLCLAICCEVSGCLQGFEDHSRFIIKPPIIAYALNGRLDKVKEYINAGGDINATDNAGNTPLMMTAIDDHYDVAKYLLAHGANLSLRNKAGDTVFDIARRGIPKRVTALLEHSKAKL